MAIRKRSPQRARRSTLEQSFHDAQAVLSGYIESGGKQVKDTMTSLLHIFDMDKAGTRTRSTRAPRRAAAKIRTSAARPARKRKAPARHAASRNTAATRRSKRPAQTKRRPARSAKRAPRI